MKASDDLFTLIHSLTKSEKGYFKKTSFHVRGDKNNYMKLFDAIERQNNYDEDELIRLFKGERFIKQFSVAKNYLYGLILESLETFHTTYNSQVKSLMHQSDILNKKGLYNQSLKRLLKAKEIAEQIKNYTVLYEVIQKTGLILQYVSYADAFSSHKLAAEMDKSVGNINNYHVYIGLEDAVTSFIKKHGSIRNKKQEDQLRQIMQHSFLKDEKNALTTKSKMVFQNIHFLYESLLQKTSLNKDKYLLNILKLMEQNHLFLKEHFDIYINLLNNLLICYNDLKFEHKFYETLKKMRDAENSYNLNISPNLRLRIFHRLYINELSFYLRTGHFENIKNISNDIEKGFLQFKNIKLDTAWERVIYYYAAYLYFGIKNYSKALYWLDKIFEKKEINSREDIYSYARILQLIINFEIKQDEDTLYNVSQSIYKYLIKKERLFDSEKIILKFVEKYLNVESERELMGLYISTRKDFEKIINKTTEQNAFNYLDYVSWLDSKIEKRDFLEIYKEKRNL